MRKLFAAIRRTYSIARKEFVHIWMDPGALVLVLFLFTLLYLIAEVGMALMISAVARTQQQAITILFMYLMFTLTMPGYFIPTSQLPRPLYWVSLALPIQHFMGLVRGVMLKGADLIALWPGALALVILDIVSITVTSLALRRVGR